MSLKIVVLAKQVPDTRNVGKDAMKEDGTINRWTKIERPNVYVENGTLKAMTFAVIDVQKEEDFGNDQHGSKIIVVPFSAEKL